MTECNSDMFSTLIHLVCSHQNTKYAEYRARETRYNNVENLPEFRRNSDVKHTNAESDYFSPLCYTMIRRNRPISRDGQRLTVILAHRHHCRTRARAIGSSDIRVGPLIGRPLKEVVLERIIRRYPRFWIEVQHPYD